MPVHRLGATILDGSMSIEGSVMGSALVLVLSACDVGKSGVEPPADGGHVSLSDGSIGGRSLEFRPTRDDITVSVALLSLHCARQATPEEQQASGRTAERCYGFRVNGAEPESEWKYFELERVATNVFRLDPQQIEFSRARDGHLCMSIKVLFNEVTNQNDALYYRDLEDRYALVSYCSTDHSFAWVDTAPRFGMNRVGTLEAFDAALSKPFAVQLNDRPLP